jgi:hypothetical protein
MTNLTRLIGSIGIVPMLILFGTSPTLLAQSTGWYSNPGTDIGGFPNTTTPNATAGSSNSNAPSTGWYSNPGTNIGSNSNAAGSSNGPNWMDICDKISFALVSSCNTLVNSDNTLTSAGLHARDCMQNGALLAGGALLLGTAPTTIVSVLPFAAKLFGCDDVVNFSKMNLGTLSGLGSMLQ